MPEKNNITEHDEFLWKIFQEWWPVRVEHVDHWEHKNENSIIVFMKYDDYQTSGAVYLFGDKGANRYFLNTLRHPIRPDESGENMHNNEGRG